MAMFERFEPAARLALVTARSEARQAGQRKVLSEHVLLGLLTGPGLAADALTAAGLHLAELRSGLPRGGNPAAADGLDADALASVGIDLDAVRRATDAAFGRGALDLVPPAGRKLLPMGDDAREMLVRAVRESQRTGQRQISSGHMLIGILDQKHNGALTLLTKAGADVTELRADVVRRIAAAA
jgi:ATP-dependent Clp protease ATP-binding subunit ClpA